jgi:probable HAF family extracellular repeat protein
MVSRLSQLFSADGRRFILIPALAAAASLAAPALPAAAATHASTTPHYAVTILPTLGASFDVSNAAGINDRGWIVGDANVPGSTTIGNATEHATLWRHGVITDLGTLGGPNSSIGFVARPNNIGLISGNAQTNTLDPLGEGWGTNLSCDASGDPCAGSQYEILGFVWKNGVMSPLPTLGGNNALAFGVANDKGQLVGIAETAHHDPSCESPQVLDYEAVVWGPNYNHIRELPPWHRDRIGGAAAINDRGQAVGVRRNELRARFAMNPSTRRGRIVRVLPPNLGRPDAVAGTMGFYRPAALRSRDRVGDVAIVPMRLLVPRNALAQFARRRLCRPLGLVAACPGCVRYSVGAPSASEVLAGQGLW